MTVTNNFTGHSNTISLSNNQMFNVFDVFDMEFEFEQILDLDSLFRDLGMTLTDLDPLVLDAES